jgi:FkbM family methyltransferase
MQTYSSLTAPPTYEVPLWKEVAIPIVAGTLRGQLWLPASGGKMTRVVFGSYEREQTRRFEQSVRPGSVVYDVGAATGYYTLLGAKLAGPRGRVISFEPDPRNAAFLRRHIRRNGWTNVTLVESAVGDHNGDATFSRGTGTGTGRIAPDGQWRVPVIRLDDFVRSGSPPPTHMKIDVEGAEMEALLGSMKVLQHHRPTLFLSTHGQNIHEACCRQLHGIGYTLEPMGTSDLDSATEVYCCPRDDEVRRAS